MYNVRNVKIVFIFDKYQQHKICFDMNIMRRDLKSWYGLVSVPKEIDSF